MTFGSLTRQKAAAGGAIVEPATNRLILSYYPSGKAKKTAKPIEMPDPADARFFASV